MRQFGYACLFTEDEFSSFKVLCFLFGQGSSGSSVDRAFDLWMEGCRFESGNATISLFSLHMPSLSFGRDIKPRPRVNRSMVPARSTKLFTYFFLGGRWLIWINEWMNEWMNEVVTYIPPFIRSMTRSQSNLHYIPQFYQWAAYPGRIEQGQILLVIFLSFSVPL